MLIRGTTTTKPAISTAKPAVSTPNPVRPLQNFTPFGGLLRNLVNGKPASTGTT